MKILVWIVASVIFILLKSKSDKGEVVLSNALLLIAFLGNSFSNNNSNLLSLDIALFNFMPTPILLADKDRDDKDIKNKDRNDKDRDDKDDNKKAFNDRDENDKANIDKANLKIDTVFSTGHEGLDAEKEWRRKASFCEHVWSLFVSDKKDNKDPMLCDFENEDEDREKSIAERATRPNKHPAVEGANDAAFVCNDCQAVCCKNCYQEYSSEENTPVSPRGFLEDKDSLSENKSNSLPKHTPKDSSKSSLIDDYADTSTEMPDYTGGDD